MNNTALETKSCKEKVFSCQITMIGFRPFDNVFFFFSCQESKGMYGQEDDDDDDDDDYDDDDDDEDDSPRAYSRPVRR